MKELEKGLKEQKGFATSWEEQHYQQTKPSRTPRDWNTNQWVDMERHMTLVAYAAEDRIISHQWEKKPLVQ